MAYLRTAFLATTAVGVMALATPAFAEVIMTPDGHYYRLVPLKAPPSGAASSVVMAIPEGATASVARFQLPADQLRKPGISAGIYDRLRSGIATGANAVVVLPANASRSRASQSRTTQDSSRGVEPPVRAKLWIAAFAGWRGEVGPRWY
jgi:hypothetical protein